MSYDDLGFALCASDEAVIFDSIMKGPIRMNDTAPQVYPTLDVTAKRIAGAEERIRDRINEIRGALMGPVPADQGGKFPDGDGSLGLLERMAGCLHDDADRLGDILDRLRLPPPQPVGMAAQGVSFGVQAPRFPEDYPQNAGGYEIRPEPQR